MLKNILRLLKGKNMAQPKRQILTSDSLKGHSYLSRKIIAEEFRNCLSVSCPCKETHILYYVVRSTHAKLNEITFHDMNAFTYSIKNGKPLSRYHVPLYCDKNKITLFIDINALVKSIEQFMHKVMENSPPQNYIS